MVSWKYLPDADQIIIVGDFNLEKDDNNILSNRRKLLCLRFPKMITKSITEKEAKSLYTNLRVLAGKGGYEVVRSSGTNGRTTNQTHKDLLIALSKNKTLLPSKAGACLIVPGQRV